MTFVLAGQIACLSAALSWAVAVTLFRRPIEAHGARSINLLKCLLAAALQGVTIWALGQISAISSAAGRSLGFLAVSGLIGLVIGDTALFGAVARIGVQRTLLLQTLAPGFTALVAFAWLDEQLASIQIVGGLVTLAGIALVIAGSRGPGKDGEQGSQENQGHRPVRRGVLAGILLGVLAAAGQGAGLVLAKAGTEDVPVLAASFVRLAAAAAGLLLLELLAGRLGALRGLMRDSAGMARVVPATIIGTYLALFLMMGGLARSSPSIAAVLLSTPPVFSLVIEAVTRGRLPSWRALLGTLIAVAGVVVLSAARPGAG